MSSQLCAYTDVTLVVDGALDSETRYADDALMQQEIDLLRIEAEQIGATFEIFLVVHNHAPTNECGCVEALQDHRPSFVFDFAEKGRRDNT